MSLDLESQLNLEADQEAVVELLAQRGGRLHHEDDDPGAYWLEINPEATNQKPYYVLVKWTRYPAQPPSVKFATAVRGELNVTSAWPQIPGYRPGAFDICMPFTAEGFSVHPEWCTTSDAWRDTGNPFLWVAEILQRDLKTRCEGRHP